MMLLLLSLLGLALGASSSSRDHKAELLRGNCPMFWYSFSGRCYKYVATHTTWAEAELHCLSEGANLVSVHSLEEQDFVNMLIENFDPSRMYTWIGLSDIHREGGWMWSDGSKAEFFLWADTQPDNAIEMEHCGHTNMDAEFRWNDAVCHENLPSVCKSRSICL